MIVDYNNSTASMSLSLFCNQLYLASYLAFANAYPAFFTLYSGICTLRCGSCEPSVCLMPSLQQNENTV